MALPSYLHRRWDTIANVESGAFQLYLITLTSMVEVTLLMRESNGHRYFTEDKRQLPPKPNLSQVLGVAADNKQMTPLDLRRHIQHIFQIPVWNHTLSNGLCPEAPHDGEFLQIDGNTWVCISTDRRLSKLTVTLSLVPLASVHDDTREAP
jgi:hypothetical protein